MKPNIFPDAIVLYTTVELPSVEPEKEIEQLTVKQRQTKAIGKEFRGNRKKLVV